MSNGLLLTETCRFKLKPDGQQKITLEKLLKAYTIMVKECLGKAITMNITSRKRLHETVYKELRVRFPNHPSHYIYTAITQALAMFKSYRRLSRKRKTPTSQTLGI